MSSPPLLQAAARAPPPHLWPTSGRRAPLPRELSIPGLLSPPRLAAAASSPWPPPTPGAPPPCTSSSVAGRRARAHNRKAGLDAQCEVVCDNFMAMPFDDASFDGAYSIEATCHAPRLQDVYGKVYRVLKPGALYVSYEWVTTPLFRADDAVHVEAIQGIERVHALPVLRRYDEIALGASSTTGRVDVDDLHYCKLQ